MKGTILCFVENAALNYPMIAYFATNAVKRLLTKLKSLVQTKMRLQKPILMKTLTLKI